MRSTAATPRSGTAHDDGIATAQKAGHTDGGTHGAKLRRARTAGRNDRDRRDRRPTTRSSAPPPLGRLTTCDGTGMTVAVIDTGVDYNNPALGGGFGPNDKVIAGYDFADNTGDPHGDHIAARHVHRRLDRFERSQRSGRRARRQDRRPARHRQLQHGQPGQASRTRCSG